MSFQFDPGYQSASYTDNKGVVCSIHFIIGLDGMVEVRDLQFGESAPKSDAGKKLAGASLVGWFSDQFAPFFDPDTFVFDKPNGTFTCGLIRTAVMATECMAIVEEVGWHARAAGDHRPLVQRPMNQATHRWTCVNPQDPWVTKLHDDWEYILTVAKNPQP